MCVCVCVCVCVCMHIYAYVSQKSLKQKVHVILEWVWNNKCTQCHHDQFYSKKPVILRKLHLMRLNMRMCRSSSDSIREGFVGRWDWVSLWRPPKNQPGWCMTLCMVTFHQPQVPFLNIASVPNMYWHFPLFVTPGTTQCNTCLHNIYIISCIVSNEEMG